MRFVRSARSFSSSAAGSEKIAMVGSGNFGSALVRILGQNALRHPVFDSEVRMYVHEEMVEGEPLTKLINKNNENVKYLPGAKFTPNVVAVPDISEAVQGATMVCFCLPHQFLKPIMPKIKARLAPARPDSARARRRALRARALAGVRRARCEAALRDQGHRLQRRGCGGPPCRARRCARG
jgi:glycerol-3-phosphate dehydrogenase (NAD+)